MKALNHPFRLTSTQKWHNIWYGLTVVLALLVFVAIVGNADASEDTMGIIILITLGLLTGITVRLGTKRGWTYYAQQYLPNSSYVFTKERKIGVLWRVLSVWFGGRFVMSLLMNQADSDLSLAFLSFVSISLVTTTALIVGLRFGWKSADQTLVTNAVVDAP